MNGTFYEQLGAVAEIFEQWGACEKTVVACALARRVPWPGLKLVQRAVEAALRSHVEDERLERDANDDTFLASLLAVRSDDDDDDGSERLRQLLTLLPLLRIDNERGKDAYVVALPALVQRCVDARRAAARDLCRQLLSYLLVHPALTPQDHSGLSQWLRFLENPISGNITSETMWQQRLEPCIVPDNNIWGINNTFRRTIGKNVEFRGIIDMDHPQYTTDLLQESFSKNGRDVDLSLEEEQLNFDAAISLPKSKRSNSLTPPSSNFMHMSSSAENLTDELYVQKPRSFSLSSEHSLGQIRPIGVMYGTTGSETRLDDLRSNNFTEYPGMTTVAQWLKSLRLHKYVWLFTNISYEQMVTMDDEYLEKLGVTKGARHKLLLSIKKLNERESILEGIEAELGTGGPGAVGRALERLRGVMLSPMAPSSPLPTSIVRILELASRRMEGCAGGGAPVPCAPAQVDDPEPQLDPMALHCWLVEKALHHESFSGAAPQAALRRLRHRLPPRQFFYLAHDAPRRNHRHRWRAPHLAYPKPGHKRWVPQYRASASGPPVPPPPRGKSHSYPPYPGAVIPRPQVGVATPPDEYSSLDALCLQMTEQAIN